MCEKTHDDPYEMVREAEENFIRHNKYEEDKQNCLHTPGGLASFQNAKNDMMLAYIIVRNLEKEKLKMFYHAGKAMNNIALTNQIERELEELGKTELLSELKDRP